jgi:hypothetical protein
LVHSAAASVHICSGELTELQPTIVISRAAAPLSLAGGGRADALSGERSRA